MFDNLTFKNERQRVQVVTNLFTTTFFDCQSYFLFDIRVKFDNLKDLIVLIDDIVIANSFKAKKIVNDVKINEINNLKSNRNDDTRMFIDVASEINSDSNKFWANSNDSDFDSLYNYSENCDIDDDCNAKLEETRLFLYCYFIVSIVVNRTSRKPNLIFMKTTLLHIKKKDKNSQM